jgi:hypothetical protein
MEYFAQLKLRHCAKVMEYFAQLKLRHSLE